MLQPGDLIPHFTAVTVDGKTIVYRDIWQRQNLLLVTLSAGAGSDGYVGELRALAPAFATEETALVITRDAIAGVPTPGVLVADRWGEIFGVAAYHSPAEAPAPRELLATVAHVRMKCPECEGEAR